MSALFNPLLVILAAGKSARFNGIKLLATVQQEQCRTGMLQSVLNKVELLELPTLIATGEYHAIIKQNVITDAEFHFCSEAHLGLGHTIAQVTNYIYTDYQYASHIAFILADQVAITAEQYQLLIQQSRLFPTKLHYCQSNAGISAPCVFPKAYWSELMTLQGDKGAKSIILKHLNNSKAIEVENANIDIDQQQELQQWNNQYDFIKN